MRFLKALVLFAAVCASGANATMTYDWESTSSGVYQISYLGAYDQNGITGNLFRKTVNRTAFAFVNPPATPLPADLLHLQSYADYVVSGNQIVWFGDIHARLWNDTGDELYALGHVVSSGGGSYENAYLFTGGLGAYSGATGWWNTVGRVLSSSTQTWNSTAHLELPSADVPEPGVFALLLTGLALIGLSSKRRRA